MRKTAIAFIIIVFCYYQSLAQSEIYGSIVDKNTGEALIGANVLIKGTSTGAIADVNGNYSIKNLPAGKYQLVCSFISYAPTMAEVSVSSVKSKVVQNFILQSKSVQIEGATIKARAVTNTENALVSMQIKSATSVNGISSAEISMNGDKNAASSLGRVSGVTVQDGKYIYVRGLGDRYSRTDLNGAMVPSMDPEKNNIQLDLFPGSIIDNMKVYKTFSPNLPANFAGGYVDIITKRFPEEFLLQFSLSVAYNTHSSFNGNFLSYQGGKTDFLGFDDGTRAIPKLAWGSIPFRYQNDKQLDKITASFNKIMAPSTKEVPLNHDFSFAIGDKKTLFGKELGYLCSLTYSHDYRFYDNGENGHYSLTSSNSPFLQKDLQYKDSRGVDYVLWGFLGSASLKVSDNASITLNLIHNQGGTSSSRYQEGWNNYHEVHIQTRSLQYSQRAFSAAQLMGQHKIKRWNNMTLKWQSTYSRSQQDEPDLRFFTNIYELNGRDDTIFSIDPAKQAVPARYWRFMTESNYDTKVDFSLPYQWAGIRSKFKFGAKLMRKDRRFSEKRFDVNDDNNSYLGSVSSYLSDSNIGTNVSSYPQKFGVFIQDATQISNTYSAYQNLMAVYALTDQQIGEKFRAVYGLRMETTDIFLQSAKLDNPVGTLHGVDFLPAVNLSFKPKKNINLRAAYTRTLARPSFRELAPYASFEFAGDYTLIGNANLERTLIDNIDFRFEWALKPGELVSFDLFYKGFINPIERTFVSTSVNDELTFENASRADVYGFEFEIRKNLDFVNALRNIKIGYNMAMVNSIVSIASAELSIIHATDPSAAATRSMYGQSPYIVNAYINYHAKKRNIDARLVFNTSGPKLAVVVKGGTPNIYEAPRKTMDFIIKKKFGNKITLSFKAKNLFNSTYKKYYTYKSREYIYSSFRLGRSFSLGFSYKI